ncbi:tRNA (adenine22-N1)-methyltransferase [Acetitomaculum ruminis DSM 5522]|uniref:tRNA (Adenine22-N1)-methyltransferase n=1 Tax=Acetitomaculum ruminis DSM 5522 TaxID=1120918 RepID=A0A1I0VTU3_9FIRM|nr:class I SAM-dependent methyltransferase [Acetitomaculum ruminis]SFA79722.1 tRNA (adenine22-N1)-methyltransferase [Acetitomaculum ruminis DSM 5522]
MKLSLRMNMSASLIKRGSILADIGTDHAYVPIFVVKENICNKAYAMDINKGPLLKAKENIHKYLLDEKIETRLSNGLEKLSKDEADCILIGGMGGELIISILENGKDVINNGIDKEIIIQPQSDLKEVRSYLLKNGYEIMDEKACIDEGKYYFSIKFRPDKRDNADSYTEEELSYGKILLDKRDNTLKEYLLKNKNKFENIKSNLSITENSTRIKEINNELEIIEKALKRLV